MQKLIATIIRHQVLANVLMVIILLAGAVAGRSMLREAFPEATLDMISVNVIYPGADVEEIEEGVSRKIEEAIDGLEGIERYTTVSAENASRASIEIKDGYSMSKARDQVENAIDSISTFPVEAEKPIITEILLQREVLVITLWGDMDERTLKETAEHIKDELQSDPAISQVTITGVREYEIVVEVSEPKLREYGLTFAEVTQSIRRGSVNLAGGSLRTKGEQVNIRTSGRKYTSEDIAKIVVITRPSGDIITMGQIATIRDGFTEDPIVARFNGHPAVMITLSKTVVEDTISIAKAGHQYVVDIAPTLPEGINVTSWADGSLVIQDRLSITFRNGIIGLCIVLITLWTFLNTRLSFWVGMGIPISISGSLIIMWLSGMTLNSVTLFGLVMVTGIVVDDAIIVGEAVYLRRMHGDPPLLAAVNGIMEVGLPVFAAVCTTIVAFLPMGFVSGVMGQFMTTMAIAVIGALAVSLFEALFILPAHLTHLHIPDPNKVEKNPITRFGARMRRNIDGSLAYVINVLYAPFVRGVLHYRYVTLCCGIAVIMITVGLGRGGFIKFTPFPNWDDNQIQATIEFPQGTPADITEAAITRTEEGLREYIAEQEQIHGPGLAEHVFSIIGQTQGGQGSAGPTGTHLGMVRVQLRHSNNRNIHSQDIVAGWQRQVGDIPGALSQSFSSVEGGPGGAPIELWLQGNDTEVLRAVADEIKTKLHAYDGVFQVEDSFRPGKRELKLDVKPEAQPMGITLDDLAEQVYSGFYGAEADRIQRGRDDVRIKVRYSGQERSTLAELENVRIRTSQGYEVPFFSVADVKFGSSPASIERTNGRRLISVRAEVDEKRTNAQEILGDLRENFLPTLEDRYSGFTISFEGSQQDSQESVRSLMMLFPIAMIGMFVIIAAIFRSYLQPFIIMLTVPFGIIGAIWGHVAFGWQIVMFSIFGMMALTGVVVNDAIVLIEAVNGQIAKGTPIFEAIAQGTMRRFRAIVLTTLSTVGALVPMIIETDLSAQPLNPMALSVASGVAFATLLTLVYTPSLLAILNDLRRVIFAIIHLRWPTREEVEPARLRNVDILEEQKQRPVGPTIQAK